MDLAGAAQNLYRNSGLAGLVDFLKDKTRTVDLQVSPANVAKNIGLPSGRAVIIPPVSAVSLQAKLSGVFRGETAVPAQVKIIAFPERLQRTVSFAAPSADRVKP
ncbi:MAG: hypothetical protein LBQ83_06615 [Candidatus Margulisbacteria bacterium]|jgi:hypothetical protein|nr:hypothetical protein [Candidatus Margulisiibacteriota bacterium]